MSGTSVKKMRTFNFRDRFMNDGFVTMKLDSTAHEDQLIERSTRKCFCTRKRATGVAGWRHVGRRDGKSFQFRPHSNLVQRGHLDAYIIAQCSSIWLKGRATYFGRPQEEETRRQP